MAMQKVVVSTQKGFVPVGNSLRWKYSYCAESGTLIFTDGGRVITGKCSIGQSVLFLCDGSNSRFLGVEKAPKDEFKKALWERGFTKPHYNDLKEIKDYTTLVKYCDSNWESRHNYQEYVSILIKLNVAKIVFGNNRVAGVFIQGRDWSDRYICKWWVQKDLTVEEKEMIINALQ